MFTSWWEEIQKFSFFVFEDGSIPGFEKFFIIGHNDLETVQLLTISVWRSALSAGFFFKLKPKNNFINLVNYLEMFV